MLLLLLGPNGYQHGYHLSRNKRNNIMRKSKKNKNNKMCKKLMGINEEGKKRGAGRN